jgi:hypothetical protein
MARKEEPTWFILSNYDALISIRKKGSICNLRFWFEQLLIRQYIKQGLEGMPKWNDIDRQRRKDNAINEWLPRIKKNPIVECDTKNFLIPKIARCKTHLNYNFNQPTVMSTLSGDFYNEKKLNELREKALPKLKNILPPEELRIISDVPFDFFLGVAEWDNDGAFTHVTIDLTATDGQIKEDFGKWLKMYRNATGRIPDKKLRGKKTAEKNLKFSDKDLKEWRDLQLLPYIDLELAVLAGENINTNTMAMLLYPEEYYHLGENSDDDEKDTTTKKLRERITQTVKPKAHALLSDDTLTAINRQLNIQTIDL